MKRQLLESVLTEMTSRDLRTLAVKAKRDADSKKYLGTPITDRQKTKASEDAAHALKRMRQYGGLMYHSNRKRRAEASQQS